MSSDTPYDRDDPRREGEGFSDDPFGTPPEPEKRLSTGAKVLIGLGIATGVVVLLCCGFCGVLMFNPMWAFSMLGNVSEDPAEVTQIRESILTTIAIPEDFQPRVGMDLSLAGMEVQFAMYTRGEEEDPQGMMILAQMPQGMSRQEMEAQTNQMLQQQGQQGDLQIESSETRTVTVDGEEIEFTFSKGQLKEQNKDVRQVMGVIPTADGPTLLLLIEDEETWDEEQVMNMLQSIRK